MANPMEWLPHSPGTVCRAILTEILGEQKRYRDIGGQHQEQQDRQLIKRHYGEPHGDQRHQPGLR
jgi:hypothetical protein